MSKESIKLYWLKSTNSLANIPQKRICYRDCAFSAVAMLDQIAQTLNSTRYRISIALYMILMHKLFSSECADIFASYDYLGKIFKLDMNNIDNFPELVDSLSLIEISKDYNLSGYNALLEIKLNKNKIFFCFKSDLLSMADYFAATMIQRFRELLKKIYKDPYSCLKNLDIITFTEKRVIREWHFAKNKYQKQRDKLFTAEQQVMLIPNKIVAQCLN